MKNTIEWHEESLANSASWIKRAGEEMAARIKDYLRQVTFHKHYAAQVAAAKQQGKDGFDADRLLGPAPEVRIVAHIVCNNDNMLSVWLDEDRAEQELDYLKSGNNSEMSYYHIHTVPLCV